MLHQVDFVLEFLIAHQRSLTIRNLSRLLLTQSEHFQVQQDVLVGMNNNIPDMILNNLVRLLHQISTMAFYYVSNDELDLAVLDVHLKELILLKL